MNSRATQRGFTLLEVLVAFAVLSMLLGTLLSLNARALETTARASDRQLALALAQSALDRVLAERELRPGRWQGHFEDSRFDWQLEVSRFEFPDQEAAQSVDVPVPHLIEIRVHWDEEHRLVLSTLRLVQPS